MRRNHYGIPLDSDIPTTGVFAIQNAAWIHEECDAGIDMHFEDYLRDNPGIEDTGTYEDDTPVFLIGHVWCQETEKYEHNSMAEYSAIVSYGTGNIQVTASDWRIRGALCSPCYPGQVDADTGGVALAFSLPPSVIGNECPQSTELRARIFKA